MKECDDDTIEELVISFLNGNLSFASNELKKIGVNISELIDFDIEYIESNGFTLFDKYDMSRLIYSINS